MNDSALQDLDEALYQGVDNAIDDLGREISHYAKSLRSWSEIARTNLVAKLEEWTNEALNAAPCVHVLELATADTASPSVGLDDEEASRIGCEMRAFADKLQNGSRILRRQAEANLKDWSRRTAELAARTASLYWAVERNYGPDAARPARPFRNASPFVHAAQSRTVWKAIRKLRSARAAGDLDACQAERGFLERYARRSSSAALRKACRRAWMEDTNIYGPLPSDSIYDDGDIECHDGMIGGGHMPA